MTKCLFMKSLQLLFYILFGLSLFAQKQTAIPFVIEKSVCNIFLQDETTTTKVLGNDIWDNHFEANNMLPRIECINKNGTEGLRLFFFYGGIKNAVAGFEVFSINKGYKKNVKAITLNITQFKSGNNIILGMSKQKVVNIIGKDFTSTKGKNKEEIKYYTDNPNSRVLKKYGGVAYFISCRFINNKLVQYNFGFEYP